MDKSKRLNLFKNWEKKGGVLMESEQLRVRNIPRINAGDVGDRRRLNILFDNVSKGTFIGYGLAIAVFGALILLDLIPGL